MTMQKITDIFKNKNLTFSFEFFPPKTDKGLENLKETIAELSQLKPDFISCTYGAGGGNRDKTLDIVQMIQKQYNIPGVAHLTCVLNTKDQIRDVLNDIESRGINNILALRGDPPKDQPDWQPEVDNFKYCYELCDAIREQLQDNVAIGVAGFPEGHISSNDLNEDAHYLKNKIAHGGDFIITQLFLDNRDYQQYVGRLRNIDVNVRVLPGVLPITNYNKLVEFCANDKISIPDRVKAIFEPIKDDPEANFQAGIDYAVQQCVKLIHGGAPGIHFYTLNKVEPVKTILTKVRHQI